MVVRDYKNVLLYFLDEFLYFLHQWKQETLLYKVVI